MEQSLGKVISGHRKRLGLTQDQLAEKLGVTAQAVSKWENDLSCPDIGMLPKLAEIFGISIDALLGREYQEAPVHQGEVVTEESEQEEGAHFPKGNWEFRMSTGRKTSLMFALTILAAGGQLLAAQVLERELSFWAALWPVALIALGVTAIFSKFSFFNLGYILFGGYFALGNWDLLPFSVTKGMVLPVILVLFGASMLVDAAKKPKKRRISIKKPGGSQNNLQYGENGFSYSASFGEETQHIHMENMEAGEINVSFGDFTVDMTGVEKVSKNCTLDISCSFGELVVLVPSRFEVKMNRSGAFSDSCVSGKPDPHPQGTIYLESSVSFGDLEVQYI